MQLTGLLNIIRENNRYRDLLSCLKTDQSQVIFPTIRAARPYLLAALAQDWQQPILFLTARGKRAYNVVEQLPVWLGSDQNVYQFSEPTPMFYDRLPWDATLIQSRLETLAALIPADHQSSHPVVVSSAKAMMQRTLPPSQFRSKTQVLRTRERYTLEKLLRDWVGLGYEPVTMVTAPGMFSRRGGILDIFPIAAQYPVRIEFFDDEIDTMRQFDPNTQRSVDTITKLVIYPAREALPELTPQLAKHLSNWFESLKQEDEIVHPLDDTEMLANGMAFPFLEHYLPYLYNNPISLLDYAPEDALIIVEDYDDLHDTVSDIADGAESNRGNNQQSNQIAPDHPKPYVDWEVIAAELYQRNVIYLDTMGASAESDSIITIHEDYSQLFAPGGRFGAQLRPFLNHVRSLRSNDERAVIITQQAKRITDLWYEQDSSEYIPTVKDVPETPQAGSLAIVDGALGEGWSLADLHVLTDAEIFGWSRPEPRRRKSTAKQANRAPETNYADWVDGDYVVHVDYGIGRYVGMQHRTVEGTDREYLVIEYDGSDRLFVPVHQADRLTRYVGPSEVPPTVNKLGKAIEWTKAREKARKNAEEEARELLEIYAKRAATRGHSFNTDGAWQSELEASFPYVETDDQLRTLREVKADMESGMPMDRLICGEVGYGKTEVALRAAFKAVMDNKQVAILVPTTVLASQHYETFTRRLAPFPIKVEMLSRFRTKDQQRKITEQLGTGEVDIIIGTHRLLSSDIKIENLGLIIIDEEQRFGVKHKEHFKKLRAHVDFLTLTATPIPRTLYMSLAGVRDISMIQTPPEDRLPVITHTGAFDEKLVRQAILREIDHGGQVFVVHNRVRTIEALRDKLQKIVPEVSIVVGHGQMTPRQLENVISSFSHGEHDILLATSIIENGIDMPTVNTLIVDRADFFGMSQLYQLRGRVGRGAQQAYAYFFHAGGAKLTEEAKARLETLAEHTHLGAGFQISMRDLELRGAGDILSTKQTGHVASVGLQLYTQMLQQAVSDMKGDKDQGSPLAVARERIVIDLPLPAYIPTDWIPEMALRLQIYRRIGSLGDNTEIEAMRDELRDRFGQLPAAVDGLLYQIQVKLLAQAISATAVIKPRQHILIKLPWLAGIDRRALSHELGDDVEVSRTAVELRMEEDIWQWRLLDILEHLKAGLPEEIGA